MRPTVRIKNFLRLLEDEWMKNPDQRFCQFLFNIGITDTGGHLYHYEESELLLELFPDIPKREYLYWGTYGKDGKQPLRYVFLKKMSNEHIKAILDTQKQISEFFRNALNEELKFREDNNIIIEDK